ncbi:MAG TPA: ABC transporter substrate-binding protein [Gammaproteobacteria bacterium]|nr:ABC transporter substrate-binding protein [Gammaproteobacteria bacterium]
MKRRLAIMSVALFATLSAANEPLEAEMSEQALRGKRLFLSGESVSGLPITATVSSGGAPLPASVLPCSGCHGGDGQGRPEGGVVPPSITWQSLTAANGHEHTYGRRHPAFDARTVAAAITQGIDPAGNQLDSTMPRYQIGESDMADLIAYLQVLDHDLDPGLSDGVIRVGTLLPAAEADSGIGRAMRQVLDAAFADINAQGGIHGRRIELAVAEYGAEPHETVWRARELAQSESVFAFVGSYSVGIEAELADIADEFEIPMIGPFTQLPRPGGNGERHTFYLTAGLVEQVAVLARHIAAIAGDTSPDVAIVHPVGNIYTAALPGARKELQARGLAEAIEVSYTAPYFDPQAVADTLVDSAIDAVLVIAPAADVHRLGAELLRRDTMPDLLLPGIFASGELFEIDSAYRGRVLIGYPSIPADHTPAGVREFEALHAEHHFGYEHSAAQISAFVAAKVLAEGLKRAGRNLSREKLLLALEGLSEFRAGLMPALSYGRKHRIGAYGGYVLEADLESGQFSTASEWISLRN